ncbi:MAG: hypothetical protein ACR2NO_00805 [Chloroflexota bacterium]
MTGRDEVAAAMAYFERSEDIGLLHELLDELAPRVKRAVGRLLARGTEESIPAPAELRPARELASREQAAATLRGTDDFGLMQVLARSIGQRIEAIEIVASADFPEGARVAVPPVARYPASGTPVEGTVEQTGTSLRVLLDNGETWQGPPSLARLAGPG